MNYYASNNGINDLMDQYKMFGGDIAEFKERLSKLNEDVMDTRAKIAEHNHVQMSNCAKIFSAHKSKTR